MKYTNTMYNFSIYCYKGVVANTYIIKKKKTKTLIHINYSIYSIFIIF